MPKLRFNVAIAKLTELNNHLTARYPSGGAPRSVIEPLVLMLAPLAPHVSEELWSRLGHEGSLAHGPFPEAEAALLVDETVEVPVQVNGKVRARVVVPTGTDAAGLEAAARADAKVGDLLAGKTVRKVIAVPGRMVNFVVG
jgi:leucyl-tRNA synthetase